MSTINIETIHTLEGMEKLEPSWLGLEKNDNGSSIFQSWHWNYLWCKQILPTIPNSRINIYVIKDNNSVTLAIIPLFEQTLGSGALKLSQFIGHRMSINNGILISDPGNENLMRQICDLIVKSLRWNQLLFLKHMNENTLFAKQLYKTKLVEQHCTRIRVKNDSDIKDQSLRLGKSKRKKYRQYKNKIIKKLQGEICIHPQSDFYFAFDELINLHDKRIKDLSKSSILNKRNIGFLKEATRFLSENKKCEIISLRLRGNAIASVLLIYDINICYFNQCGFDSEFRNLSPLRILLTDTMEHVFFNRNCEYVDFGPGYEAYKSDWSPIEVSNNYFGCISADNILSKSTAKLAKFAIKRSLPKSLITAT